MTGYRKRIVLSLLATLAVAGSIFPPTAGAQAGGGGGSASPDYVPMRLYGPAVLGTYSRAITTDSSAAQAYFTQGFVLMYAFTPANAVNSFREAERRDPSCTMCFWGEAWALGPYLNAGMDSTDAPRAYRVSRWARHLATIAGTPVERALAEAMTARYPATWAAAPRKSLDSAYSAAMGRVYRAFPTDPDVGTLYAESLMLLERRRGAWDLAKPAVRRIHRVLEAILARDIHHPGACHFYIHATESTTEPGRSEACAEFLGDAIPGASHINHMPSHVFNQVGRWGDAVAANLKAYHSDQLAAADQAFAIYPSHNLHMLVFSASYDGQGAVAIEAGRNYARLVPGGVALQALALVRFGRFAPVLELSDAPADPIFRGLWQFARGYAQLRLGHPDSARAYLERVDRGAKSIPDSVTFRGHHAPELLGTVGGILRGALLESEGHRDAAVSAFEVAVSLEDALRFDEPEPLDFTARDWLGEALLAAGRADEAAAVYREALVDHPGNGWSLFGLAQALGAEGLAAQADTVRRQYSAAWERADVTLTASRF